MLVKKEERKNLSIPDRLKLAKSAREGGADKLTVFESDCQTRGDFRGVCNLFMRLESLSKAIEFCDMGEVLKRIPRDMIALLDIKLKGFFNS